MQITIANTDDDITACYRVLHQLRPKLNESTFVDDVRRLQTKGYVLASLRDDDDVVRCVAGYRYYEMFATGVTLYVDDLVTDAEHRSSGHGKAMLDWLIEESVRNGCNFLTLDSGLKRLDAHRFYRKHGLQDMALHFAIPVDGGPMWTSE